MKDTFSGSEEKNEMIRELIRRGEFKVFRDVVTLLLKAKIE